MRIPESLLYTSDHEWVEVVPEARDRTVPEARDRTVPEARRARIGITDFAQDALGEVVFVAVPAVGTTVQLGMTAGEVESSKSVSDIYAPVSGEVVETNTDLAESPQRLNDDPYGGGWICVIEMNEDAQLDHLLDSGAYRSLVEV